MEHHHRPPAPPRIDTTATVTTPTKNPRHTEHHESGNPRMQQILKQQEAMDQKFKEDTDALYAARHMVDIPYWVILINETGIPVFSDSNYTSLSTDTSLKHYLKTHQSPRTPRTPGSPSNGRNSQLMLTGLLSNLYKSVDNHGTVALDSFSSENAIISYEELQAQDLRPIQELSETKRTERNALLILIVGKHALEPSSRDMAKQTLRHIRELFKTYVDPLTIGNILQNPNNRKLRSTLYPVRARVRATIEELGYSMTEPGTLDAVAHPNVGIVTPFCTEAATALRCRYFFIVNGAKVLCANPAFWKQVSSSTFELVERARSTEWGSEGSTDQHPLVSTFDLSLPAVPGEHCHYSNSAILVMPISFHLTHKPEGTEVRLNAGKFQSHTRAVAVFDPDDTRPNVPEQVRRIHVAISRRSAKDSLFLETMTKVMRYPEHSHRSSLWSGYESCSEELSVEDKDLENKLTGFSRTREDRRVLVKEFHRLGDKLPDDIAAVAHSIVCIMATLSSRTDSRPGRRGCRWTFWDPGFGDQNKRTTVSLLLRGAMRQTHKLKGESWGFMTSDFSVCSCSVPADQDSNFIVAIACHPAVNYVNQFHSLTREFCRHFENPETRKSVPMTSLWPAATKLRLSASGFATLSAEVESSR